MIPNRRLLRHGDAFAVLESGGFKEGFVMFVLRSKKEVKRWVLKVLVLVLVAGMEVWGEGKGKGRE
jgi:hypothetical protein